MIAYVNIVDDLGFKFPCYLTICFNLYTDFIVTKKIVEEIMFENNAMIGHNNMFFPLVRYVVFN